MIFAADQPAGRGRRALRAVLVFGAGVAAAIGYLNDTPPPAHPLPVLVGAAVSVGLFTLLALYPGRLAPALRPTPAWWGLFAVLVVASVSTRWFGGEVWIVLTMATAATAGAVSAHQGRALVVGVAVAAGAALALGTGVDQSTVVVEGVACGIAALFGNQAWRRVILIEELTRTRLQLARAAVADERLRIARDLHDLLGHTLALVLVRLEVADRSLDRSTELAREEIRQVRSAVQDSLVEIREAVVGYRHLTLASELTAAGRLLGSAGIAYEFDGPEDWQLSDEVDATLGWVVREAVTNVVKHSHARTCGVSMVLTDDRAAVGIADDGTGRTQQQDGSGLANIADRITALGGACSMENRQPTGFVVRAAVPTSIGRD